LFYSRTKITYCEQELRLRLLAGKGDGDVSENDFVEKLMRRLEGHGSSLTTSVKNDVDWEPFRASSFSQKVSFVYLTLPYLQGGWVLATQH